MSDYWDENFGENDILKHELFDPIIMKKVREIKPKLVLDAGCGEGYLSRLISPFVEKVIAVDMSKKMIRIAKQKSSCLSNITYHIGNCREMDYINNGTMDCALGQMFINSVVDFKEVLAEFSRILRKNGLLILSSFHPCFVIPGGSKWLRKDDFYIKNINNYFSEGLKNFHLNDRKILTYHRTLSTLLNTIITSSFSISEILELRATKRLIDHNEKYRRMDKIPSYMLIISQEL